MNVLQAIRRKGTLLLFVFTLLLSTLFSTSVNVASAAVASDFQVSVMGPLEKVTDWQAFKNQLRTLKSNGVHAITTDVWWGIVEGSGDNQFDWSYYKTYANAVREVGLKWVPIISTHQCGGNVNDNCNFPLPSWLWTKGSLDEMAFKDETGYVNKEALSPFWKGIHTQYAELYSSFAQNFSGYKDIIAKIYLSGGPAGELRYPSYAQAAGWQYPSRGKFQVYTETAKQAFRAAMLEKYGSLDRINQAWGIRLTSLEQINPPGDRDGFYTGGGYQSAYGKDFLGWYQRVLENHLAVIANAAHSSFDSTFGVRIGAKISGIHWQMNNSSMPHSAEQSAGYYDYSRLVEQFKQANLDLTFTCLEMYDDGSAPNYSLPSTLVNTVSGIAKQKGVRLNGENALPAYGASAFQKIEEKVTSLGYNGFTLLRLQNIVNADGSANGEMDHFKKYVIRYAQSQDPDQSVTIYYKQGFANPYIHYRPEGGQWTTVPGIPMEKSEVAGYYKITIDIGATSRLEACFNDKANHWDSNQSKNYFFNRGTFTYTPGSNGQAGTITAGAPLP